MAPCYSIVSRFFSLPVIKPRYGREFNLILETSQRIQSLCNGFTHKNRKNRRILAYGSEMHLRKKLRLLDESDYQIKHRPVASRALTRSWFFLSFIDKSTSSRFFPVKIWHSSAFSSHRQHLLGLVEQEENICTISSTFIALENLSRSTFPMFHLVGICGTSEQWAQPFVIPKKIYWRLLSSTAAPLTLRNPYQRSC